MSTAFDVVAAAAAASASASAGVTCRALPWLSFRLLSDQTQTNEHKPSYYEYFS